MPLWYEPNICVHMICPNIDIKKHISLFYFRLLISWITCQISDFYVSLWVDKPNNVLCVRMICPNIVIKKSSSLIYLDFISWLMWYLRLLSVKTFYVSLVKKPSWFFWDTFKERFSVSFNHFYTFFNQLIYEATVRCIVKEPRCYFCPQIIKKVSRFFFSFPFKRYCLISWAVYIHARNP